MSGLFSGLLVRLKKASPVSGPPHATNDSSHSGAPAILWCLIPRSLARFSESGTDSSTVHAEAQAGI
ncbi:MAG: hypothetical protein ABJL35_05180 [Parasphingorhabdus sp.]|uniref:hypothetical protein n=1 Tax=Parasphingorhabdus sp. TaxID=2709688 RepID=UPI003298B4AC